MRVEHEVSRCNLTDTRQWNRSQYKSKFALKKLVTTFIVKSQTRRNVRGKRRLIFSSSEEKSEQ